MHQFVAECMPPVTGGLFNSVLTFSRQEDVCSVFKWFKVCKLCYCQTVHARPIAVTTRVFSVGHFSGNKNSQLAQSNS